MADLTPMVHSRSMAKPTPGSRPAVPPRPGPLPGTEPLTPANVRRLLVLTMLHLGPGIVLFMVSAAAVVGSGQLLGELAGGHPLNFRAAAIWTATFFALFLLSVPVSFRWSLQRFRKLGWLVGYFDQTATMLVHANADGDWEVSDHHAVKRGHRLARPFRERVFTHLAEEADRHRAVIVTTTLVPKLARSYQAEMPGLALTDDRHRDPLGRRLYQLRREPR